MPSYEPFSGAPYPNGNEGALVPANLNALLAVVGPRVVLYATSVADRDTKYANLPAGAVVSCPQLRMGWQKLTTPPTTAAWQMIWEAPDPVTTGVVLAFGDWQIGSQWGVRRNGKAEVSVSLNYNGSDISAGGPSDTNPGNVIDTTICTLVNGYRPLKESQITARCSLTSGTLQVNPAGSVVLTDMNTSSKLVAGQVVRFSGVWSAKAAADYGDYQVFSS